MSGYSRYPFWDYFFRTILIFALLLVPFLSVFHLQWSLLISVTNKLYKIIELQPLFVSFLTFQ